MTDTRSVFEAVAEIVAAHQHLEGPLLPILHAVQEELGYVPDAAIDQIGDALNVGRAEVHGVASFYHDFRKVPAGRHTIKICRAEACQSLGGKDLGDHALARLGTEWHGTTANGAVTVEPIYCLGLCACGPAVMVDGQLEGRVDSARLDEIVSECGA